MRYMMMIKMDESMPAGPPPPPVPLLRRPRHRLVVYLSPP